MVAQSWGAQLDAAGADRNRLQTLVDLARSVGEVRELIRADAAAILALDRATIRDYPGGVACAHPALTSDSAQVSPERRAFGVVGPEGDLVAMTFVDIGGDTAETDFTVVAPMARGRGLGAAVKPPPRPR